MCDDSVFNLEERVLCSDGACIGLIGPDGNCKVCGASYEGDESLPEASLPEDATFEPAEVPEIQPHCDDEAHRNSDERICCPDDTCIGIIGEDGRCGTCGAEP